MVKRIIIKNDCSIIRWLISNDLIYKKNKYWWSNSWAREIKLFRIIIIASLN